MPYQAKSSNEEPPLTFELQLLRNKDKMTNARAQNDNAAYWVYFDTLMGDMVPFMATDVRAKLENKHGILLGKIEEIKGNVNYNELQKEKEILKLKVAFADENKYYISKSLSRTNIIKIKDEGIVDLKKETIDSYAAAIRDDRGIEESSKKLEE